MELSPQILDDPVRIWVLIGGHRSTIKTTPLVESPGAREYPPQKGWWCREEGQIWVLIGGLPGAPTRGKQKKVKKTLNYILN